jgi:diamine oxidase
MSVFQDLVAWISMGVHHIPHTEDLPVTPTVGLNLNFYLLPYNYFDEDPAIASRNAIRIDVNKAARWLVIERYGVGDETCAARKNDYDEKLAEKPGIVLDMDRDVVF